MDGPQRALFHRGVSLIVDALQGAAIRSIALDDRTAIAAELDLLTDLHHGAGVPGHRGVVLEDRHAGRHVHGPGVSPVRPGLGLVGIHPAFEYVFNTPSHRRVHHGSNDQYLDRNYGGILILWDRWFGTFEPEDERVRYGLTTNIQTYNPLRVAFHEWAATWRDVRRPGLTPRHVPAWRWPARATPRH